MNCDICNRRLIWGGTSWAPHKCKSKEMQNLTWDSFIAEESKQDYFKRIQSCVEEDSKNGEIYPKYKDLFSVYKLCPLDKIKICVLGQDPFHGPGQAHGLSFSVPKGIPVPPSLKNIYKELHSDLGLEIPKHGCLLDWVSQGVFLLNSVLTVRKGSPGSHKDFGWQTFTDKTISVINNIERPIVFMLWGAFAKSKRPLITNSKHLILEGGHPSPYSSHLFFEGKYFSKANDFLVKNDVGPIDWRIG